MKFKRRHLASFPSLFAFVCPLLSMLLPARLHAQEASGGATVQANIDLVSWGEDLKGVEVGESGSKHKPASALAFRYSDPVKYSGPQVMAIYWDKSKAAPAPVEPKVFNGIPVPPPQQVPGNNPPEDTGKIPDDLAKRREKEPNLAALVPLIAGASQMTVLLAPGPQGTFHCYVIDDEPTRFPWGKIRMHNYAAGPIGLQLNKGKMVALKYQESMIAPTGPDGSVTYQLSYMNGDKWKAAENNILHVNADEQIHFIVLQSDATYFRSSDGSKGGKLQTVTLRRQKQPAATPPK